MGYVESDDTRHDTQAQLAELKTRLEILSLQARVRRLEFENAITKAGIWRWLR